MEALSERMSESIQELASRWLRAREAAIFSAVGQTISEAEYLANLSQQTEEVADLVLKSIFLNSRNLGQSYQQAVGLVWEQQDFSDHASSLGSPCFQGEWSFRSGASVLSRPGCFSGKSHGQNYCQYWREAMDGLVMGLTESDRFVRHGSMSVGDMSCIDIIYTEEETPTEAIWNKEERWGPLPPEYVPQLKTLEEKFRSLKVDLVFLGISEKKLFYKLEPKENLTCGGSGAIYRNMLDTAIKKAFPDLHLSDASPVAIMGEKS